MGASLWRSTRSQAHQDAADAPLTLQAYADVADFETGCLRDSLRAFPEAPEVVGACLATAEAKDTRRARCGAVWRLLRERPASLVARSTPSIPRSVKRCVAKLVGLQVPLEPPDQGPHHLDSLSMRGIFIDNLLIKWCKMPIQPGWNHRTSVRMTRIDPEKKMAKWYEIDVQPTLFGEYTVERHWGGGLNLPGDRRHSWFHDEPAAD